MKDQLRRAWQRVNDPKVIALAALLVSLLVPGAGAPSVTACLNLAYTIIAHATGQSPAAASPPQPVK